MYFHKKNQRVLVDFVYLIPLGAFRVEQLVADDVIGHYSDVEFQIEPHSSLKRNITNQSKF